VLPLPWLSEATVVVSVLVAQLAADGGAAEVLGAAVVLGVAAVRGAGMGLAAVGAGDGAGALSPPSEPNQRPTRLPLSDSEDASSLTDAFQPLAGAAAAVRASDGSGAAGAGGGGALLEPPMLGTIRFHRLDPEDDPSPELTSVANALGSALATAAPPSSAISLSTSLELEALRAWASSASPWLERPAAL
jgi:hypothetical protein